MKGFRSQAFFLEISRKRLICRQKPHRAKTPYIAKLQALAVIQFDFQMQMVDFVPTDLLDLKLARHPKMNE